jgi:archaellum component FlaG (FlaF/FlaG flagellin family)
MFIKGKIANLEYPYILASYLSADTLAIDTITVDNKGRFNYRNHLDTLTTLSLYLNNYESAAVVFANEGDRITIEGDAQLPDLIKINGNEVNDDLTSFKISNIDLLTQRGQLLRNMMNENKSDTSVNRTLAHRDEMARLNVLNQELN